MQALTGKLALSLTAVATAVRYRSTQRKIRRLLKERTEISIEVGAGDKKGVGEWLTIDVAPHCDLYWDLRKGIPFPDDRINRLYSSHFFEHLTFSETQQFLQECKRVLIPGGKFLICVPNARMYLEAYVKGESISSTYFGYEPAYNHTTRIDYVNYTAYMNGEHKYMFDQENLVFILKSAGFANVQLRDFDPDLDMQERDFESIYAQAEK
jgi:predicted SAM-dependent methyltransferase